MVRSSVDFPHPLGPIIAVKEPSGTVTDKFREMILLSYPKVAWSTDIRAPTARVPCDGGIAGSDELMVVSDKFCSEVLMDSGRWFITVPQIGVETLG